MLVFREGRLEYVFSEQWMVTKYDNWPFYQKQFAKSCCTNKAVDFLAYNRNDKTLWLIELKDYRQYSRTKEISLWEEVALKVKDTLAGIVAAKMNTAHDNFSEATLALRAERLRVVLHLEQPSRHSKPFPRYYDRSNIQEKMKQILKPIDPHPKVIELNDMEYVPWDARSC